MATTIECNNKKLLMLLLYELDKDYNKYGMYGVFIKLIEIRKNPFIDEEGYNYIKRKFYRKYCLLTNIRKVLHKWKQCCRNKKTPVNNQLLDLSDVPYDIRHSICKYPQLLLVTYPYSLTKWIFSMNELKRIVCSSLYYSIEGMAQPCKPKNPYTNIPFTIGQLSYIYNNLIKSGTKVPLIIHKFKKCDFCITRFRKKYNKELIERASYEYVLSLDDEEFNTNLEQLIETYNKYICSICVYKYHNIRLTFSKIVSLYIIYVTYSIDSLKIDDIYLKDISNRITNMIGHIIEINPQFTNSKSHRKEHIT